MSNYEFSWMRRKLNGYPIVPPVRDQGDRETCVFYALCAAYEMEYMRYMALHNQPSDLSIDVNAFIKDYEKIVGSSLEDAWGYGRMWSAAHLMLNHGISTSRPDLLAPQLLHSISTHGSLSHHEVSSYILYGRPLLGTFPYNTLIRDLDPHGIYDYLPNSEQPNYHMVAFVGVGNCQNRAYLVYINSWGVTFGENGFGRVYLDNVYEFKSVYLRGHSYIVPELTHEPGHSYGVAPAP